MSNGADTNGTALFDSLSAGMTLPAADLSVPAFTLPGSTDSRLYQPVERMVVDELTTGAVNGGGVFDSLMVSLQTHLKAEFAANRITGSEYAKTYVALTQSALQTALQFMMDRETAYWQAVQAQEQAVTARVEHEKAKLGYAVLRTQGLSAQADLALAKMKLATEDVGYAAASYQLANILPLTKQKAELDVAGQVTQNASALFQLEHILPKQETMLTKQTLLAGEQVEVQRAQTQDTRLDGAAVVGLIGKQKDLYNQQITSYKRDIEIKGAKLFTDAWITMKTIDEGLSAPDFYTLPSINGVLGTIKTNLQFA